MGLPDEIAATILAEIFSAIVTAPVPPGPHGVSNVYICFRADDESGDFEQSAVFENFQVDLCHVVANQHDDQVDDE